MYTCIYKNEGFEEQFVKSAFVLHRPLFQKVGFPNIIVDDPGGCSSKAWVFSRLIAGIASSNPADGVSVRLFCWLCTV